MISRTRVLCARRCGWEAGLGRSGVSLVDRGGLRFNLIDADLEILLAVTLLASIVLAAALFYNGDLVALELTEDCRGNLGTFDNRLTDLRSVVMIADEQDPIELDRLSVFGKVLALYLKNLTLFDTVLMGTVTDNRVHVVLSNTEFPAPPEPKGRTAWALQHRAPRASCVL